jgi:hypothetical protein
MDAAAVGVAQKENDEGSVDQQDIFYRVVFFLAALTRGLFKRVLGADDAPFRAIMGKSRSLNLSQFVGDQTGLSI